MTSKLLCGQFLKQWLEMGVTLAELRDELGDPKITQPHLVGRYFEIQHKYEWADVCFGGRGRKAKGVPTYAQLVTILRESDDGGDFRLSELLEDKKLAYGQWQRDKARLVKNQMLKEDQTPEQAAYALEKESRKGGNVINHSEFLQSYHRERAKDKK